MIWEINRIKEVFEKSCYGDRSKILTDLKKCYNYYRSVNIENKELSNRLNILRRLIREYTL